MARQAEESSRTHLHTPQHAAHSRNVCLVFFCAIACTTARSTRQKCLSNLFLSNCTHRRTQHTAALHDLPGIFVCSCTQQLNVAV
jgi:hypothetical protein